MRRLLIVSAFACYAFSASLLAAQVAVHVQPATHLDGPRELADQTQQGVIRDYLSAWKTLQGALDHNQPGLLNADFVGTAKDRLIDTINQQVTTGIHSRYQDRSHDLQIVFYSPEGLSIQLTDTVDYDVQVFDGDKQISSQTVHERYIVVLTPAEVRWRVRVFQPEGD